MGPSRLANISEVTLIKGSIQGLAFGVDLHGRALWLPGPVGVLHLDWLHQTVPSLKGEKRLRLSVEHMKNLSSY